MSEGVGYGGGYESFDIPIGDDFTGNVNEEGGNDSVPSIQQTPYKYPGELHQNQHAPLMDNMQYHQHHVLNMGGPVHQAPANQPQNYGYQPQNHQCVIPAQLEHPPLQMNQIQFFQSHQGHHDYRTLQSSENQMASQIGQLGHLPLGHYPFHDTPSPRSQPYPSAGFPGLSAAFPGQAGTHHHKDPMGPATPTPIQFFHSQERQNPVDWPDVRNPGVNYCPETPDSQKCYEQFDPPATPMISRQDGMTSQQKQMNYPIENGSTQQDPSLWQTTDFNYGNNVINPAIPAGNYNQGPLAPVNATYHADAQDDPILNNDEMEVEEPAVTPKRKKRGKRRNNVPTELQSRNRVYQNRCYAKRKIELYANIAKLEKLKPVYQQNEASINEKKQFLLGTLGRDPLSVQVNHVLAQTRNDENYKIQLAAKEQAETNFRLAGQDYLNSPINKFAKAKSKKKYEMETVQTRVEVMEKEFKIARQEQVLQLYDGYLQSFYYQDPNVPNGQHDPG